HVNHRSVQQLDPLALEQAGARELFVLDATNRPELLLRNVEHGSSLKLASFALAGQSAPHSPSSSGAALDARPAASAFRASFLACARPLSPPALVPAPRCAPISSASSVGRIGRRERLGGVLSFYTRKTGCSRSTGACSSRCATARTRCARRSR